MKAKICDFEMNYEISGNEAGDWLVLIHGLAGSIRCWKYQLEDFNNHFRVLSLDMVGHGESTGSSAERYSGQIAANHIRMLMDKLGIEKAHMLALSLGAIIQQYFCEMFPERVISTVYASPATKHSFLIKIINGFFDKVFLKVFSKNAYLKIMGNLMLPGKIQEKSRKIFIRETMRMDDEEFFKWWKMAMGDNCYDHLTPSCLPALIVVGEKDICFYKDAVLLSKKYKNSDFRVFKDCGHVIIFQKREEFNALVIEYIKNFKDCKESQEEAETAGEKYRQDKIA